ncbi:hypothetical protein [Trichlorobacter lovleyi]|uniref:hypothetical protein n=1 Tax=Trichlorobacter lovleyi TaxID=313985 RepID=UPI0023EF5928|nr:hypothetical protein [Trichlorobacter lovleyi]
MRCEKCLRKIGRNEIVQGIRFGTVDDRTGYFLPSRESAYTVICQNCGEQLLREIYNRLNKSNFAASF